MRKQQVQGIVGVTLTAMLTIGVLSYNLVSVSKEVDTIEKDIDKHTQTIDKKDNTIDKYKVEVENLKEDINTLTKSNSALQEKIQEYKKKEEELKKKVEKLPSRGSVNASEEIYEATFYTAKCKGCSGWTRTEYDVRNTIYYKGYRIVAVDPTKIPLYSILRISYGDTSFEAIAIDTGGDIKGNRLDILVQTKKEAFELGRKSVSVQMLRKGK